MTKRIDPEPPLTSWQPRFIQGQKVRLSQKAIHLGVGPKDTTGVVEWCDLVVAVVIDGNDGPQLFAPDFWDAIL